MAFNKYLWRYLAEGAGGDEPEVAADYGVAGFVHQGHVAAYLGGVGGMVVAEFVVDYFYGAVGEDYDAVGAAVDAAVGYRLLEVEARVAVEPAFYLRVVDGFGEQRLTFGYAVGRQTGAHGGAAQCATQVGRTPYLAQHAVEEVAAVARVVEVEQFDVGFGEGDKAVVDLGIVGREVDYRNLLRFLLFGTR